MTRSSSVTLWIAALYIVANAQGVPKGALYILDAKKGAYDSSVVVVDPNREVAIKTFAAGYNPDIALSPDGQRIYIASTRREGSEWRGSLVTVDTRSGAVVKHVENKDHRMFTLPTYPTSMRVSADGRSLFIVKNHQTIDNDEYYIATYDTTRGEFLSGKAPVPNCVSASILPAATRASVQVVCGNTSDVREIELGNDGNARVASKRLVRSVPPAGLRLALGANKGNGSLFALTGDGKPFIVARNGDVTPAGRSVVAGDRWVRLQDRLSSGNGSEMYIASGRKGDLANGDDSFTQIVAIDSNSLEERGIINTSIPFYAMALDPIERKLFGVAPQSGSVIVLDSSPLRKRRVISGLVTTPTMVIVAP